MAVLKAENLTYRYSIGTPFEKTAVEQVNLEIPAGSYVGIIGHTGSGKSTLIQLLCGILKPTEGQIYLDQEPMWDEKGKSLLQRFRMGMVFQYPEYQLFEETVFQDIAYGPKNMGLSEEEIKKRVEETAEIVGLSKEMLEQNPFALSGGQKRRVAIAGVMAMQPEILILDEPIAGLDPKGREEILQEVETYRQKTGSTIMMVSHSMEDVARYAEKILVMNKSKLFCYDTVDAVFSRSEELQKIGLALPQITSTCNALREQGWDLPNNIYTVEQAVDAVMQILTQKRGEK